jgi:hypothetical protein
MQRKTIVEIGLPENSGGRNDVVEFRIGGKVILDTVVADQGSIDHHHHWSTRWRIRGSECHSSAVNAGSLDTISTVRVTDK